MTAMSLLWLSSLPSLLAAFFHCFGVRSRSLLPVSARHALLKGAAGSEGGRKKGKEEIPDTGKSGAMPTEHSWGKCTAYR